MVFLLQTFFNMPAYFYSRYEILREIGSGGCGVVYLARDSKSALPCAVKRISAKAAGRELRSLRLYKEFVEKSAAKNLIPILDIHSSDGELFYSMPLCDGVDSGVSAESASWRPKTLEWVIENQKSSALWFSSDCVLGVFLPIVEAICALNESGLVHRDVKPANILFLDGRPCLADIGLMAVDSKTLSVIGTPDYTPPYWYLKSSGKPDMWGLASTLFNFITGYTPDCMGRFAFMWPECGKNSFSNSQQKIFADFHKIIYRATNQDPKERFIRISDFKQALEWAGSGVCKFEGSEPGGLGRARQTKKYLWPAALPLFCALVYLAYRGGRVLTSYPSSAESASFISGGSGGLSGSAEATLTSEDDSSKDGDSSLLERADYMLASSPDILKKIEDFDISSRNPPIPKASPELEKLFRDTYQTPRDRELTARAKRLSEKFKDGRLLIPVIKFPEDKWGMSRLDAELKLRELHGLLKRESDPESYMKLFFTFHDLLGDLEPMSNRREIPSHRLNIAVNGFLLPDAREIFHEAIYLYHSAGDDDFAEALAMECRVFAFEYAGTRLSYFRLYGLPREDYYKFFYSVLQEAYEDIFCHVTLLEDYSDLETRAKILRYILASCANLDGDGVSAELRNAAGRELVEQLCGEVPRLLNWIIENDEETLAILSAMYKGWLAEPGGR